MCPVFVFINHEIGIYIQIFFISKPSTCSTWKLSKFLKGWVASCNFHLVSTLACVLPLDTIPICSVNPWGPPFLSFAKAPILSFSLQRNTKMLSSYPFPAIFVTSSVPFDHDATFPTLYVSEHPVHCKFSHVLSISFTFSAASSCLLFVYICSHIWLFISVLHAWKGHISMYALFFIWGYCDKCEGQ